LTLEIGGEIDWRILVGLAIAGIIAQLIYARFFKPPPWVPPEDALFVDTHASVIVTRSLQWNFSWPAAIWVTEGELGSAKLDAPIPLSSIKSIRTTKWFIRNEPVVVVEWEGGTIQMAVHDWHKLNSVLAHGAMKAAIQNEGEA
jgi:hypothetical protein